MTPSPQDIRRCLLVLASERGAEKTFCPSEAARRLDPADWRRWLPQVGVAAIRLVKAGKLRCTQRGREVDPETTRGPLRFADPRGAHQTTPPSKPGGCSPPD